MPKEPRPVWHKAPPRPLTAGQAKAVEGAVEVYREMLAVATAGFSLDTATGAIEDVLAALSAQARAAKGVDYDAWARMDHDPCIECGCQGRHADRIAKAMQATSRTLDELTRLTAFAQGQPDHRTDLGASWLTKLTDAQLAQVEAWILETERRRA